MKNWPNWDGCPDPMTDRQQRYEARRRESGWRMISVRLDAETLAMLERLAELHGGDKSAAMRAAITDAAREPNAAPCGS